MLSALIVTSLVGLASGVVYPDSTRISGTLLAFDGRPIAGAQIHLHGYAGEPSFAAASANADGTWTLDADTTGVFLLWFSAPGYEGERVGLLLTGTEEDVRIDARLDRHELRNQPFAASLIGDFNEFRTDRGSIPLRPRADGTLAADVRVEADSLAYQLLDVALMGPVPDPTADRSIYDGKGAFQSVIEAKDFFLTIALDPSLLVGGSGRGTVSFADEGAASARFGRFTRDLFGRVDAYFEKRARADDAGATLTEMREIYERYDPTPDAQIVTTALAGEPDPELRDLIRVTYMGAPIKTDPGIARAALDEVPPASPAWSVQPRGLSEALGSANDPERARDYALALLAASAPGGTGSSSEARSTALGWLLEDALARDASDELAIYHSWLVGEYPESKAAGRAAALYAPDRQIQPGNRIPYFEVRSMEDSTITYSRDGLEGSVVMLDFWATWCGPCITEMPYLQEAFEEFANQGFTILSLSFDIAPEDVENFRAEGDWPMPWLHTYVTGGADSDLATSLDVVNIPRAILVGRDGTILATNEALRGARLRETLAAVMGSGSGGGR
jgi:thiol-disulfide isomerase/thioredoxin